MKTDNERDFTYKVKCRSCGRITSMFFGTSLHTKHRDFVMWAHEHSTFPIEYQCGCDNESMLFHDIVSYSPIV